MDEKILSELAAEEKRLYQRKYYKTNRTHILETQRQWRKRNKKKVRAYDKKWCANNPEKVREYQRRGQEKYWQKRALNRLLNK